MESDYEWNGRPSVSDGSIHSTTTRWQCFSSIAERSACCIRELAAVRLLTDFTVYSIRLIASHKMHNASGMASAKIYTFCCCCWQFSITIYGWVISKRIILNVHLFNEKSIVDNCLAAVLLSTSVSSSIRFSFFFSVENKYYELPS